MHPIDLTIIIIYLIVMALVGWWVAKKASGNAESYFLAGKSLPWWVIGVAHGSSGVDITGTMWFVMMLYIYGLKAVWLLWVWPLFSVIFRMMYLGTWVRRSNVLTGAEWMRTRFGNSRGARLAYLSVVVYALVHMVGFLGYAFRGIGEFTRPFFPWDLPDEAYATAMLAITGIYCVVGGMYSVVMNDLIQFVLKVIAAIGIAVIAIVLIKPEQLMAAVSAGWDQLFFGTKLTLDWSTQLPELNKRIYNPIDQGGDGYSFFMFFTGMLFLKGVLVSMAGPTPNYAIQHILSTRSPREAALENMVMALVSLAPRFLLIGGIAVLGIVLCSPELAAMGTKVNFEKILPQVLHTYVPVGFKGILIAALIASFMSTFVSTVNSGAAYVVNDIYKRYINPHAPSKRYVVAAWITSSAVICLGIAFGFMTKNIHSVTEWIVSALVPAFVAPNVLKWHWWRFNGYGFFAGMVAGTAAAVAKIYLPIHPVFAFLLILAVSFTASILVCWLTEPEGDTVLEAFYTNVRPWGFWEPVYERCRARNPNFQKNRDFRRDMFNIAIGLVWQTSLVTSPIYLVIQHWKEMWVSLAVCAVTSLILKFSWYDKLGPGEMYLSDDLMEGRAQPHDQHVHDRASMLFGFCSQFLSPRRLIRSAIILKPATLLRLHRRFKDFKYRFLYSSSSKQKPGPKGPAAELIRAICELKQHNPRFGCPKIAQHLAKTFGIEIDKDVVRRVLAAHYHPEGRDHGPSWLTVLGHSKDSLWSVDLFRTESILLRSHWVLVVMDQFTRRIVGFGVQAMSVDGRALCRMFNQAICGADLPVRLSFDHDPLFQFQRWQANLRILGIEAVQTVLLVPCSHPFVERLIGSLRREYLDQLFYWNAGDLERKLELFRGYFNETRAHQGLGGDTPEKKAGCSAAPMARLTHYRWQSHSHGLVHLPIGA